jgi:hypothetical protein
MMIIKPRGIARVAPCACNKTNLMHYLNSVYSVTIPLHVSGLLVAHHQEAKMYICNNWYMLHVFVDCRRASIPSRPTDSRLRRTTAQHVTIVAYILCYLLMMGAGYLSRYSDWLRAGRSGDRIPVGARFFVHVQTGPEAHPAFCTMGIRVNRPGRGADHPPPSSAEVENG